MKPETKFRQNQVLPFLQKLKNTYYESIQQLAISGSPDIILCVWGRFVALELKSKEGKLEPLQKYKLNEIKRTGGIALRVSPQNWEEVKENLSLMDQTKEEAWK